MHANQTRRAFLAKSAALAGSAFAAIHQTQADSARTTQHGNTIRKISEVEQPLAITMVDYSWMLKHHRYGAYESFDRFFADLVERGYNAVRMDCFPHLIAADDRGQIRETFTHRKDDRQRLLWGHDFSIVSNPRKSLIEFLTKCREHGVHAGLTTWFIDHGTDRSAVFKGLDEFIRAWDETLRFIDENGLMDVVTYVDLLNEYPMAHGLEWLSTELNARGDITLFKAQREDANIPPELPEGQNEYFNPLQIHFYQEFMTGAIQGIKSRWPDLDVFTSETGRIVPQDYRHFDAIDKHFWFVHNDELTNNTGFRRMMWQKPDDTRFAAVYANGLKHWDANKHRYGEWMDGRIRDLSAVGREYGVPVGNTEGWGAVFWEDHPLVDWRFIKESAELAIPSAVKHGYKFICTSNFTAPQFVGMWENVAWHQEMTRQIKG